MSKNFYLHARYIINKRLKSLFNIFRAESIKIRKRWIIQRDYNSTNEKRRLKNMNILIYHHRQHLLSLNTNDESSMLITQPAIVWLWWPILFFFFFSWMEFEWRTRLTGVQTIPGRNSCARTEVGIPWFAHGIITFARYTKLHACIYREAKNRVRKEWQLRRYCFSLADAFQLSNQIS